MEAYVIMLVALAFPLCGAIVIVGVIGELFGLWRR